MPVIHHNPGLLDTVAFTCFGVTSKPNTNSPIGYFGTGLKYAIAVLMRHQCKLTLFIGRHEYVFFTKEEQFRDKTVSFVYMRQRKGILARWTVEKLPFTTELGKNWELWQAYRELHSNALDEGGGTYARPEAIHNPTDTTFVIDHWLYDRVHEERDKIFLDTARLKLVKRDDHVDVEVYDKPSRHLYYRGMRIMDMKEGVEATYTYNFLSNVDLTEDRTAKYPFLLEARVAEMLMRSKEAALVRKTVAQPSTASYEGRLNYSYTSTTPSSTFMSAARVSPNAGAKKIYEDSQAVVAAVTHLTICIPTPSMTDQQKRAVLELVQTEWPEAYIKGMEREAEDNLWF